MCIDSSVIMLKVLAINLTLSIFRFRIMKKLIFIPIIFLHFLAFCQVNCPTFPKAKKEKIQFKSGNIQISNFVNTFWGLEFQGAYSGIFTSGLGVSQDINRLTFKFDLGGAKNFINQASMGYLALSAGYNFIQRNDLKWRLEATIHRLAEERKTYIPTLQLVHSKKGKFLFGDFNYGFGLNKTTFYLQLGVRWGIYI